MPKWEYCLLGDSNTGELVYILFARGDTVIQTTSSDQWGECIALLGLLGWEAFSAIDHPGGTTMWRFKRMIHSDNQYLTL